MNRPELVRVMIGVLLVVGVVVAALAVFGPQPMRVLGGPHESGWWLGLDGTPIPTSHTTRRRASRTWTHAVHLAGRRCADPLTYTAGCAATTPTSELDATLPTA